MSGARLVGSSDDRVARRRCATAATCVSISPGPSANALRKSFCVNNVFYRITCAKVVCDMSQNTIITNGLTDGLLFSPMKTSLEYDFGSTLTIVCESNRVVLKSFRCEQSHTSYPSSNSFAFSSNEQTAILDGVNAAVQRCSTSSWCSIQKLSIPPNFVVYDGKFYAYFFRNVT